jgi:hypothetical protein
MVPKVFRSKPWIKLVENLKKLKSKSVDSFFDLSFDAVDEIKLDVSETLLEFDVKEEVSAQFPKDLLAKCCQERNQNKYVNCLQECRI